MGCRCVAATQRRRIDLQSARPGIRTGPCQGQRILVYGSENGDGSNSTSRILVAPTFFSRGLSARGALPVSVIEFHTAFARQS